MSGLHEKRMRLDDFMTTRLSTTLADLFTLLLRADPDLAVRTASRAWPNDEIDDGVANGW
jgi:hypothetical protein